MSGVLSCGSARATTHTGSQWHDGPNWLNDALSPIPAEFMSTVIAAGFGPINVPFLSSVTQLAGTGYNALAAVPTLPLPTVFPVDILVGNTPQRWFLIQGTTSGGDGIVVPNDYNAVTNAKYWVQLE